VLRGPHLLALVAVAFACCEPQQPAAVAPSLESSGGASPRGTPRSDADADAGVSDAAEAADVAADSPPTGLDLSLVREAAPGPTQGSIACGKERCKAGSEVCALGEGGRWRCLKASEKSQASASVWECDEASDCQRGQSCCLSFASAAEWVGCAEPKGNCALELCIEGDGAPCRAGLECKQGACVPPRKPATCGPGKTCPAKSPMCVYRAGKGSCVDDETARKRAENAQESGVGVYACTRPSDCGGGWKCCTSMSDGARFTRCGHACDSANTMQVCERDLDCKPLAEAVCGGEARCMKNIKCQPAPADGDLASAVPGWMKVCR